MPLQGRHLKVGAGIWAPWVEAHENTDGSLVYSGLIFSFFDNIAEKLNFTYSIQTPADGEWGRLLPNGSFTGIIGMCERKDVDLILGPAAPTWERSRVADFSVPIYTDYYKIFLPRPRIESDFSNIVRPFTFEVWVVLAITLCVSVVLASAFNFVKSKRVMNRSVSGGRQLEDVICVSSIIRILFAETIMTLPKSHLSRLYLASWMIGGFILQTAYSGVLTSILAVPKVQIPVNSLQDLVDYNRIPWMIEHGISIHNDMMQSKKKVHKSFIDKAILAPSAYEVRHMVRDYGMALVADVFTMKRIMSEDFSASGECKYYIAKENLKKVFLCLGFPKGSNLVPLFNKWLTSFKESGIITRTLDNVAANATACLVKPGDEEGQRELTFSVKDLSGIFLLLAAGIPRHFLHYFLSGKGSIMSENNEDNEPIYHININNSTCFCDMIRILFSITLASLSP